MTGEFTRNIGVETNDPSHPRVNLTCKGRILEPVTLKPRRISMRRVSRTATGQMETIVITPGDAGPLKLKLAVVESEFFEVELREIEKGKHYELEVTLTPPLPAKAVRTNLKLETGLAQAPNITIPVSAIPRPHVVASPPRFSVPAERKPDWRQVVRLEWDDDAPHRILGATASDPGLKVKVIEKKGQQEVVLEISENHERRPRASIITIMTDDTEAPMVRVPVRFSRKAPSPPTRRTPAASLRNIETKTRKIEGPGAKAKKTSRPSAKRPAPTPD